MLPRYTSSCGYLGFGGTGGRGVASIIVDHLTLLLLGFLLLLRVRKMKIRRANVARAAMAAPTEIPTTAPVEILLEVFCGAVIDGMDVDVVSEGTKSDVSELEAISVEVIVVVLGMSELVDAAGVVDSVVDEVVDSVVDGVEEDVFELEEVEEEVVLNVVLGISELEDGTGAGGATDGLPVATVMLVARTVVTGAVILAGRILLPITVTGGKGVRLSEATDIMVADSVECDAETAF